MAASALCLLLWSGAAAASFPEVVMDPRVELVSSLALLAGADATASGFYEHPIAYGRRLRRELGASARHPAVLALDAALRRGLTSLDLYDVALRLSPAPPYELQGELPDAVVERLGGPGSAARFAAQASEFARDADFAGFWSRSEPERRALLAAVQAQADDPFARRQLESYTGLPAPPYRVILSPEAEPVFAWSVRDASGVTSVFGPERFRRDWLLRRRFRFNLRGRLPDLWRESVEAQLASLAASSEESREVAVAVSARMQWLALSRRMGELALVKYGRVGMPHLAAIFQRLAAYEGSRGRYATLPDFYPELRRARDHDGGVSDFSGGLEALWGTSEPVAVIAPGGAQGPWAARALKIWPQAQLLDPRAAASAQLSGRHVVAIGSADENPWVAENWKALRLPLALTRDGLTWARADREARRYKLAGRLGLVTTAPHPTDRLHAALLYTAADAGAVPALEPRAAPGLDFLVLDAERVVKAGLYEKSFLPWRPK